MTHIAEAHAVAEVILTLRRTETWARAMANAFRAVDEAVAAEACAQVAQDLADASTQLTNLRLMERAQDDWGV